MGKVVQFAAVGVVSAVFGACATVVARDRVFIDWPKDGYEWQKSVGRVWDIYPQLEARYRCPPEAKVPELPPVGKPRPGYEIPTQICPPDDASFLDWPVTLALYNTNAEGDRIFALRKPGPIMDLEFSRYSRDYATEHGLPEILIDDDMDEGLAAAFYQMRTFGVDNYCTLSFLLEKDFADTLVLPEERFTSFSDNNFFGFFFPRHALTKSKRLPAGIYNPPKGRAPKAVRPHNADRRLDYQKQYSGSAYVKTENRLMQTRTFAPYLATPYLFQGYFFWSQKMTCKSGLHWAEDIGVEFSKKNGENVKISFPKSMFDELFINVRNIAVFEANFRSAYWETVTNFGYEREIEREFDGQHVTPQEKQQ